MENRKVPALIALAGVVVAVAVFLFVADDDTANEESETTQQTQTAADDVATDEKPNKGKADKPSKPDVPQIVIEGGGPVGGVQKIEVTSGEELRVDVKTDVADELHLHGFDLFFDIVPGKTNRVVVPNADIEGVVELESHSTGALLAEISVVPG